MSLEDRGAQHDKVPVDKYHDPVADYEMSTRDYVLRPDSSEGAITITLPPVAEAKGRWYSIISRGGPNVTIEDNNDDSECWQGDIVLNGACDRCLLYSDGLAWHPIGSPGEWPGFDTTAAPGTTEPPTSAAPTSAAGQSTAAPTTAAPTTGAPTTA
jgi:hypothetical protein